MPFVLRVVEPKYLSRTSLHDESGVAKVKDDELLAVTNCTLSNALKQLASLVILANDVFSDLTSELNTIGERSKCLQLKISKVSERVELYDPKKVPVPEGNLSVFALRKEHYECKTILSSGIFTPDTRPQCLKDLYLTAGTLDAQGGLGSRGGRNSPLVQCTPVLGARRRRLRAKVDVDIETRLPAALEELRKWTSSEAVGDLTVAPDGTSRVAANMTLADLDSAGTMSSDDEEALDHQLPSPEEQFIVIAAKFPAEMIKIDTSGRGFDRMCHSRRSLLHMDTSCDRMANGDSQTVKRRTRSRKPRGKRRNTITGTDQKEIRDAIAGDIASPAEEAGSPEGVVMRSHSSDLLKRSPYDINTKKSHFDSLKQWGRSRLRLIGRSPSDTGRDSSRSDKSKTSKSPTVQDIDDVNIYETVTMRRRKNSGKQQDRKISHERNNSYSSSEKSIRIPHSAPTTGAPSLAVKLRETTASGRRRRAITGTAGPVKEEPHSSSGNWSASSESGRTSIGSEITSTTAAPRSSTSAATSSNSLNILHGPPSSIVSRRRFLNTSGSGSVTSEGTLTPDIIHDLHDDMETSSEYSCDTEGYYTSFHMDSGLKTLKEEDISLPITPLHTTSTFTNSSGNQSTAENEYELFGKGSTSTTTSSAGTVCTTLLAAGSDRSLVLGPTVPERKSSLSKLNKSWSSSSSSTGHMEKNSSNNFAGSEKTNTIKRNTLPKPSVQVLSDSNENKNKIVEDNLTHETVVAMIHQTQTAQLSNTGAESPDSGHNTSSSPVDDSMSSAHGGKLSCAGSELDYSESSDLEGIDRIERIRVKTTINSSRIPSMCVITPNNSDDESLQSSKQNSPEIIDKPDKILQLSSFKPKEVSKSDKDLVADTDIIKRISSRPKLELPPQETDLDTLVFNDNATDLNVNKIEPHTTSLAEDITASAEVKHSILNNILSKKYKAKKQAIMKRPDSQKCVENRKSSFMPLNNLMCKLKDVFPQKLSLKKTQPIKVSQICESLYADNDEYVTIADVRNNNQKININKCSGVYYSNDVVKRNLQTVLSGKLQETEYVSLNELPSNISTENSDISNENVEKNLENATEALKRYGARVLLDSEGKVIYSSDSLRRRKGAHTTFEPGPFVKNVTDGSENSGLHNVASSSSSAATVDVLKNTISDRVQGFNVQSDNHNKHRSLPVIDTSRPLSPQLGKLVIRAPHVASGSAFPTSEIVRIPPSNIVSSNQTIRPMSPRAVTKGAYVNIQDAEGISLSPIKDNDPDYRHSSADRVLQNSPGHPVYLPLQTNLQNQYISKGEHHIQQGPIPTGKYYSHDDLQSISVPSYSQGNAYWTLQPKKSDLLLASDPKTYQRSVTPDITRDLYSYPNKIRQPSLHTPPHINVQNKLAAPVSQMPPLQQLYYHRINSPIMQLQKPEDFQRSHGIVPHSTHSQNMNIKQGSENSFLPIENRQDLSLGRVSSIGRDSDSLKMSPIDPRSNGRFKSSTPTRNNSAKEENSVMENQITSPVKSTMSNEELYAVIHKSKKKMNIKSPPLDRAGSPALSVTSLSPGSSESSISGHITPIKMPETGYLNDARMRHSWSPNFVENNCIQSDFNRMQETSSPRPDIGTKQNWTCADRMGPPPQTSRLDFKKLLLQHGVKLNTQYSYKQPTKISAVERLKISKDSGNVGSQQQNPNYSNVNILDLSGSPKTYTHRRIMRTYVNPAPCSPSRTNVLIKEHKATPKILLSPKTQWRFSSPRSDVLSSPIPEAFNEDESPNGSIDKDQRQLEIDFSDRTLQNRPISLKAEHKVTTGARRSLIPPIKENVSTESTTEPYFSNVSRISPIKDNIFLTTQENNFTKLEQQALSSFGQPQNKLNLQTKVSRADMLQAQKAQFLAQDTTNASPYKTSSNVFKHPSATNFAVNIPPNKNEKCPSPPTLETAL